MTAQKHGSGRINRVIVNTGIWSFKAALLIAMALYVDVLKGHYWVKVPFEVKVISRFGSVGFQTLAFAASSFNIGSIPIILWWINIFSNMMNLYHVVKIDLDL